MKLRICSDMHLEMGSFAVEALPGDDETVMVLAGDVGYLEKPIMYRDFVEDLCARFRHVIYVWGNHEFYKGFWPYSEAVADETFEGLKNLSWGKEFELVLDDVAFACSTLWADFDDSNPISMWDCKNGMNDFRLIRTGPKHEKWKYHFRPEDALAFFRCTTKMFLKPAIKKHTLAGKKVVVVTHHAPSRRSIPDRFRSDKLNGA